MSLALLSVIGAACVVGAFVTQGPMSGVLTLLGLATGLLVGLEWKDAKTLVSESTHGDHHMPHPHLPPGFFIYVIASVQALVAGLLLYVIIDQRGYEECMARWQDAATKSTNARAAATEKVDVALDKIVMAIPDGDRAKFADAVTGYIAERNRQQQERKENPIPVLPEVVCGRVR